MQLALPRRNVSSRFDAPATRAAVRITASALVVGVAYLAAAWYAGVAPFRATEPAPYSQTSVMRAVPFDAPLPYDRTLLAAGRGGALPYHVVWTSTLPPDAVGQQVLQHLRDSPKWQLTERTPLAGAFTTHLARIAANGQMTHFAELSVRRYGSGSLIAFDFTPIPTMLAPR
ncbi:MAG: hypothetical protein ACYDEB_10830 [Dehalococcoidia bacterium]